MKNTTQYSLQKKWVVPIDNGGNSIGQKWVKNNSYKYTSTQRTVNKLIISECAKLIMYWSTKSFEAWLYLQYRYVILEKGFQAFIYIYFKSFDIHICSIQTGSIYAFCINRLKKKDPKVIGQRSWYIYSLWARQYLPPALLGTIFADISNLLRND